MRRAELVSELTELVHRQRGPRTAVAVDGPDAAGKSTLADELARHLPGCVVRASVDGFHHPRAHRQRRGPLSAEGYYRDCFDYASLRHLLLEPFRSGAAQVVLSAHDLRTDSAVAAEPVDVEPRAVLVVDGVFLLRPELRHLWDISIYLHVDPDVTLARARLRDLDLFGSESELDLRYRTRYLPGQELYRSQADPAGAATLVVDNTVPETPIVLRRQPE